MEKKMNSYAQAISVLFSENFDANKIVLQIAKTSPSVIVAAFEALYGKLPDNSEKIKEMAKSTSLSYTVYNRFFKLYANELWFSDIMRFCFPHDGSSGQKISAIKCIRDHAHCGLKEAKEFVEALTSFNFPDVSNLYY